MMSRVSERIDRERARAEVSRWIYPHPSEGPLVHEPFFIVGVVRTFGVSCCSCVYRYQGTCSLMEYVCRVYVCGCDGRAFVRSFVRPHSSTAMDDSVARVDWRVVDAVDEAWASERLPDDGARVRSRS